MKMFSVGIGFGIALVLAGHTLLSHAGKELPTKPQTPAPPYPYQVESFDIEPAHTGSVISGTLTIPNGRGPFPAAVLLSVAGPNDRDQSFAGHAGFHVLADHLTRRGFAVARYDDRGVGGSTGSYFNASWDDLAQDALAVAAYLSALDRIDNTKVGYIGMSQGGAIGALAAASNPDKGILILLSAPGLSGEQALRLQLENTIAVSGIGETEAAQYRSLFDRFIEIIRSDPEDPKTRLAMRDFMSGPGRALIPPYAFLPQETEDLIDMLLGPWYRSNVLFDPETAYGHVKAPALIIGGGKDFVAPPQHHVPEITRILCLASDRSVSHHIYPGLNHLLQEAETGLPTEYASLTNSFSTEVLLAISRWLETQSAEEPAPVRRDC